MERIERLLQLHFAALTAIGGLLLSGGEVGPLLPTLAVVAAIASHILVDRLQVFALPTTLAYIGMGVVAAFCMVEFYQIGKENNQLTVVAHLLVLVVIVLLFQRKTTRVFEQIAVFCLLELVVAAVFNSAMLFGLMLVPFALVGMRAMVLLQTISTINPAGTFGHENVRVSASDVVSSLSRRSVRLVRFGVFALTPPVLLVTAIFFYALPRADGSNDGLRVGGRVTTGFDTSLTLDQVGELLNNRDLVMRVRLTNRRLGTVYESRDPLYLRGQTLSDYDVQGGIGLWESSSERTALQIQSLLPMPYDSERRERRVLFDDVGVEIELQPLTAPKTLFSIAPYHSTRDRDNIYHLPGDWLLRHTEGDGRKKTRLNYEFGTHAFSNGVQTDFIRMYSMSDYQQGRQVPELDADRYQQLTQFHPEHMPTIAAEAETIAKSLGEKADSRYELARAIEEYLAESGKFTYTMSLTEKRNRAVDPIEEFVSTYRRGHCQYFASAMVMMLRSQGVPARLVAGYRSDEFNSIGEHYIVRQLHAHTWVEVVLQEDDVPIGARMAGQPKRGLVLARFDPTPYDGDQENAAARMDHFYDFAQSLWNNYVLDMNGDRQEKTLFGSDETAGVSDAYSRLIQNLKNLFRMDASNLEAGALAEDSRFSWRAAVLGVIGTLIIVGLYQIGLPRWLRWRRAAKGQAEFHAQKSKIGFYQQMCDLLESIDIRRRRGQTPQEFADHAAQLATPTSVDGTVGKSLRGVVDYFYELRYGSRTQLTSDERADIDSSLRTIEHWTQQDNAK